MKTLDILFDEMMDTVDFRHNTRRAYRTVWAQISPVLGGHSVSEGKTSLSLSQVGDYLRSLDKSPRTIALHRAVLNSTLNFAVERGLLEANPLRGFRFSGLKPAQPRERIELDVDKIVDNLIHLKLYDCALAVLLAGRAGLRRSEIRAFSFSHDWDMASAVISVNYQVTTDGLLSELKTVHGKRRVPISQTANEKLALLATKFDKEQPFCNDHLYTEMQVILKKIRNHLPYLPKFGFHDLRHQYASDCRDRGIPIEALRTQLGHATIQTTLDVYSHPKSKPEHLP